MPIARAPTEARAVALVDDCGQVFPILLAWRKAFGGEVTGWAEQIEATDVESLPQHVTDGWGPGLRLDRCPAGT
ncbi:hypothetical protein ACF1AY_35830 [Streptomyces sp. NPDC014776]|uniref:hypothetical protein n=1 Tax=unclassified Streptomyces TaxID=2593676 RepID=UPI0036FFDFDA